MSVKSKVMETLTQCGVDVQFLERDDDGTFPFIVFNVAEQPLSFSDDEEDMTLFMISVNIFSKPNYNFESLKLDIIQKMKEAGFKKGKIPNAEFLETENCYNQPMGFLYYE